MSVQEDDFERLCNLAHDWRERLEAGAPSESDRLAFEEWLDADTRHVEAWERSKTLIAAYDFLNRNDIDEDLLGDAAPAPETVNTPNPWTRFLARGPRIAAMAAAIGLLLIPATVFFLTRHAPSRVAEAPRAISYSSGVAETKTVLLEDGSEVALGASTSIKVTISDVRRYIELSSGAALFDVAQDAERPFSVAVDGLTATAVGTVFDVRSNGGVRRVAVAEGKVAVAVSGLPDDAKGAAVGRMLNAGEQIAATPDTRLGEVVAIAPDSVGAWRDQKLIYNGGTLRELIADANRYSRRPVVFEGVSDALKERTITASFNAGEIDAMLETLAFTFPLEIDGGDAARIVVREASPE